MGMEQVQGNSSQDDEFWDTDEEVRKIPFDIPEDDDKVVEAMPEDEDLEDEEDD